MGSRSPNSGRPYSQDKSNIKSSKTQFGTFKTSRIFDMTVITEGTSGAVYGAQEFMLSQLPNYTEYTALFDQYRIMKVEVDFFPLSIGVTNNNSSNTIVNFASRLITAIDYDDSTAPSSTDALRQYSTAKVNLITDRFSRDFVPAISTMVYEGVSSTAYEPGFKKWLSTNDPNVPHYGLKWAVPATVGIANAYQSAVSCKVFLEFKNAK